MSLNETTSVSFDPRVVLRPRTLDEVFDLAMAYGRTYRRDFLRLTLILFVPAFLLTGALKIGLELNWAKTWAITLVLATLIERVTIAYAGRHLFGNAPSIPRAIAGAMRRPISTVFSALLIPLPLLIGLLDDFSELSIGFGVMIGMFWPFALAWTIYLSIVLNLEALPFGKGTKRSALLVSYRFGRAIGFVATTGTIRVLAAVLGDLGCGFLVGFLLQLGEPLDVLFQDGGSWASIAGYYLIAPYCAVARLFDYVDARTRLEGWDIQVRFKAIAAKKDEPKRKVA